MGDEQALKSQQAPKNRDKLAYHREWVHWGNISQRPLRRNISEGWPKSVHQTPHIMKRNCTSDQGTENMTPQQNSWWVTKSPSQAAEEIVYKRATWQSNIIPVDHMFLIICNAYFRGRPINMFLAIIPSCQ